MPDGTTVDLDLEQKFQQISGRVALASAVRAGLREARLRGDVVRFAFVDAQGVHHQFAGRVLAGRMEGTVAAAGVTRPWRATPTTGASHEELANRTSPSA